MHSCVGHLGSSKPHGRENICVHPTSKKLPGKIKVLDLRKWNANALTDLGNEMLIQRNPTVAGEQTKGTQNNSLS